MLHDNCATAWIVFTQARSHQNSGGYGEITTTGDAYTEEAEALNYARACMSGSQVAWVKRIRVHEHL